MQACSLPPSPFSRTHILQKQQLQFPDQNLQPIPIIVQCPKINQVAIIVLIICNSHYCSSNIQSKTGDPINYLMTVAC